MSKKHKDYDSEPEDDDFNEEGYPRYSDDEDIFEKDERYDWEEEEGESLRGKGNRYPDDGLDIPGAELDDPEEDIGSEDEENNYYSLGGENHEDLEEDDDRW